MTRWPSACGRRAASSLDCLRRLTRRWLVAIAVVTLATNIHVTWLSVKRLRTRRRREAVHDLNPAALRCLQARHFLSARFVRCAWRRSRGRTHHSLLSRKSVRLCCPVQRPAPKNTPPVSANTVSLRGPMLVRCSEARDAVCKPTSMSNEWNNTLALRTVD